MELYVVAMVGDLYLWQACRRCAIQVGEMIARQEHYLRDWANHACEWALNIKKEKDVSMKNKQQDELNRKPHTTTGYIYILPNQDELRIPTFWRLDFIVKDAYG